MTFARGGRFADDIVASWLSAYAGIDLYVGLFTIDPATVSDPATAEVAAMTYSRAISSFHLSGRLLVNDAGLLWAGLPSNTTVVATGIWLNEVNGSLLCSGPVPTHRFPQGGYMTVPAGGYVAGLDA